MRVIKCVIKNIKNAKMFKIVCTPTNQINLKHHTLRSQLKKNNLQSQNCVIISYFFHLSLTFYYKLTRN